MSESSLSMRWGVILVIFVLGLIWISPNFAKYSDDHFLAKSKMTLGLDIQGGLHVVMGVDVDGYIKEQLAITAKELESRFREDGVKVASVQVIGDNKDSIEIA